MANYENYPEVLPSPGKQVFSQPRYSAIPPSAPATSTQRQNQICGITAGIFALIVGLIGLLVGAAIGGGVAGGVTVSHCNNKLASIHSSTSPTNSTQSITPSPSLIPGSTSTFINYTIPTPNTLCGTPGFTPTYITESGFNFTKTCAHNYVYFDIIGVVALTWDLCMEACGRYNAYRNSSNPTTCVGVTFVPSWVDDASARQNISFWANCFLKYKVPDLNTVKSTKTWEVVVSTLQS